MGRETHLRADPASVDESEMKGGMVTPEHSMHSSAWKVDSPKVALTEFWEVRRFFGALTCFVPWRTYIRLTQEYADFVTWPADAA